MGNSGESQDDPTDPNFIDPEGRRILRPGEKLPPFDPSTEGDDDIPF